MMDRREKENLRSSSVPGFGLREIVERRHEGEERCESTLPDSCVVVIQEDDENLDGSFDVREERPSCRSEEVPDDIGCYLLLDGDGSVVGSEKLFELSFLLLEILEVVVVVLLDGFRGGEEVWKVERSSQMSASKRER